MSAECSHLRQVRQQGVSWRYLLPLIQAVLEAVRQLQEEQTFPSQLACIHRSTYCPNIQLPRPTSRQSAGMPWQRSQPGMLQWCRNIAQAPTQDWAGYVLPINSCTAANHSRTRRAALQANFETLCRVIGAYLQPRAIFNFSYFASESTPVTLQSVLPLHRLFKRP